MPHPTPALLSLLVVLPVGCGPSLGDDDPAGSGSPVPAGPWSLLGGPCREDADCGEPPLRCASGDSDPAGLCWASCDDDADCGLGNICGFLGRGRSGSAVTACLKGCRDDSECRADYPCSTTFHIDFLGGCYKRFVRPERVGGPCAAPTDCAEVAGTCFPEAANPAWPGGFCGGGCWVDHHCGPGNYCTVFGEGDDGTPVKSCMPGCQDDQDCRDGYECRRSFLSVPPPDHAVCWVTLEAEQEDQETGEGE